MKENLRQTARHHVLPKDPGADTNWFYRMKTFQREETLRQAYYKREKWSALPDGVSSKRPTYHYPHILPEGHLDKNFYPPIYEPLRKYLKEEDIALHTESLNLKSSQVCCFNFLFPFRLGLGISPRLLSGALPGVRKVSNIEFEYAGPDRATEWLGEPPGGKRGQNRTSVDAAIWWQDEKGASGLTLIEWKYTEAEFGPCGGYNSPSNKQKEKCRNLSAESICHQPQSNCYLATRRTDRTSRRYWENLAQAGISLTCLDNNLGCPFRGPFYQLFRLYLLRAYCQRTLTDVDRVDVAVIGFQKNIHLRRMPSKPPHLRQLDDNVIEAWNRLLTSDAPPLRWTTVEEMMTGPGNAGPDEREWRKYIRERYGVQRGDE